MEFNKYLVPALDPVSVVVWGEEAMGFLGVKLVLNSYMLVPAEADFDIAVQKLLDAGFTPAPWSYGSCDPRRLEGNEELQRIHRKVIPGWETVDNNSVRFQFPDPDIHSTKVVLLRSTYVGLSPPMDEASTARYHRFNHLYYPDKILLLENFIKTLLKEPRMGAWPSCLKCWAIPYLYGMLMIEDSALDMSDDEQVKEWFNKNIRRWEGGFDRTTGSLTLNQPEQIQALEALSVKRPELKDRLRSKIVCPEGAMTLNQPEQIQALEALFVKPSELKDRLRARIICPEVFNARSEWIYQAYFRYNENNNVMWA